MHVQIVLDAPHATWTNLDYIRGRVVLRLFSTTPLTSIVVKLEGESRTRLMAAPRAASSTGGGGAASMSVGGGRAEDDYHGERPIIRNELHKILYKVSTVFPEPSMEKNPSGSQRHYTLGSGEYSYPFVFKVPFNNTCSDPNVVTSTSLAQIAGLKKGPNISATHVKKTLPPTLTAFPGLAEIRYYLKATVKRREFYKENPRIIQNLNFLPIEPPRPPVTGAETYARRQHQFTDGRSVGKQTKNLLNSFKKNSSGTSKSVDTKIDPPSISVDARLPSPAILTCNDAIPLRILVKRLNASSETLFLQSLHVQLSATTRVKAGEIIRDEASNWVILTTSNMNQPLLSSSGGAGREGDELVVDSLAWANRPLPNTVAPTFETCNIFRKYELEVHVGISYGASASKNTTIIPLHHPVLVYSGITPPPALLAAMAKTAPARKPVKAEPRPPEKTPAYTAPSFLQAGGSSGSSVIPSTSQAGPQHPPRPMQPQQQQFGPLGPDEEAPPPSYEDAIAENMPPLDGPRRDYNPPPLGSGDRGFGTDRKGRRDS